MKLFKKTHLKLCGLPKLLFTHPVSSGLTKSQSQRCIDRRVRWALFQVCEAHGCKTDKHS